MKTMFNLLFMAIVCTMCVCCSNDIENIDSTNENLLNDPTRKVFASTEDFQNYCTNLQNTDTEEACDTTIISSFKALTKLGKLFNAKNEYQIGDTIYKIGDSGYTQYKIAKSSYLSAITLIDNEMKIINSIQSYHKINDITYEIIPGALLTYTGKPIIEIKEIATNSPQARTNTQYDTKVTVSFWVAHPSSTEITCGFKVSAIKESTGKAFNTNLTLEWKGVYVELGQSGAPSDAFERFYLTNSGVSKANSSNLSFISFKRGSMYANSLNINLLSGTITGGAKAPNGKFVYATIKR